MLLVTNPVLSHLLVGMGDHNSSDDWGFTFVGWLAGSAILRVVGLGVRHARLAGVTTSDRVPSSLILPDLCILSSKGAIFDWYFFAVKNELRYFPGCL